MNVTDSLTIFYAIVIIILAVSSIISLYLTHLIKPLYPLYKDDSSLTKIFKCLGILAWSIPAGTFLSCILLIISFMK